MKNRIIYICVIVLIWLLICLWLLSNVVKTNEEIHEDTNTTTEEEHIQKHYDYYVIMKDNWFLDEEIELIKEYCKVVPEWWTFHNCLAMTTAIKVAENWKTTANVKSVAYSHNNLFSIRWGSSYKEYSTRLESISEFMEKYNTYWYKNNCTEMMTRSKYLAYSEDWKYNCLYTVRAFDELR